MGKGTDDGNKASTEGGSVLCLGSGAKALGVESGIQVLKRKTGYPWEKEGIGLWGLIPKSCLTLETHGP